MIVPILLLCLASFVISWVLTFSVKRLAPRIGFVDKPGGRKIHANPKPLGGGIAIFWAFAIPLVFVVLAARVSSEPPLGLRTYDAIFRALHHDPAWNNPAVDKLGAYWSGIRQQTPLALTLLGAV